MKRFIKNIFPNYFYMRNYQVQKQIWFVKIIQNSRIVRQKKQFFESKIQQVNIAWLTKISNIKISVDKVNIHEWNKEAWLKINQKIQK
jgi:hypothetical protein